MIEYHYNDASSKTAEDDTKLATGSHYHKAGVYLYER
ncbi:MAG: hypothetical protein ACI952_002410 [Flavobacteriales bacterium]|jgi:hypothetical protein